MNSKKTDFRENTLDVALIQRITPIDRCLLSQKCAKSYTKITIPYTLMRCRTTFVATIEFTGFQGVNPRQIPANLVHFCTPGAPCFGGWNGTPTLGLILTMIDITLTIPPVHACRMHLYRERMLTLLTFLGDMFRWLSKNGKGVTTVEYAVMLAILSLAIALSAPNIRDSVIEIFEGTSDTLLGKGTCCD